MSSRTLEPFRNEPFVDFSTPENTAAMRAALAQVRGQLGREYPLLIDGKAVSTPGRLTSTNPAHPSQVVGLHAEAGPELAESAIQTALKAFQTWRKVPMAERAELLFKVAGIVRARKFEFSAWLVYEVGKNWAEADADTAEAIDFLDFYAREALRLAAATTPIQYPGERNQLLYFPLGVAVVLPPWNFPFAIMLGMSAAAIVAGNTVVLKPSPFAPTIAALFVRTMEEAGLPSGVLTLLQGGPELGNALVVHPKTRLIAFTGSKKVGLHIHEAAARTQPGQTWIKRTILELGGKDAIIVCADADLDSAAAGIVASAFGFNGQKCSACSRVIIEDSVYDALLEKVVARTRTLTSGDPADNAPLGPVSSQVSYDNVLRYIETGKSEGKLVLGGHALTPSADGYNIAPTIFSEVAPTARIAQEEIFGPVLAAIRARDFEDALAIANNTEYGLTGAIYTSSPATLDRARLEFEVGNLYFNRKCTGAMVGAHPFGGFNMSGTDSKAGGPEYLYLFTQAKSVAEKLTPATLEPPQGE